MSASEIRTLRTISSKLVRIEELDRFFGILIRYGIGVKEVEDAMRKSTGKLRDQNSATIIKKRREMVTQAMIMKRMDNRGLEDKVRRKRNHFRKRIEDTLGRRSRKCRWLVKSIKEDGVKLRMSKS